MLDTDKITGITTAQQFDRAAMELFAFQSAECAPYREYLSLIGVDPRSVGSVSEIPFLPIEVFKARKVYCGPGEPEKIFTSSTTGGDTPSKHYMHSLAGYEQCFGEAFRYFYGDPHGWSFYCLLPGYLEREGSSLVYMAASLIKQGGGGFYLRNHERMLEDMAADRRKKILLGVSYALWELAENHAPKLTDTVVMETGGMKGRREELPKQEFHKLLCSAFGVEEIHSEYGMAELSSQAYSSGGGVFRCPPWMRVSVRDVNDPFERLQHGRTGGIDIIDLGNIYSCAFIQTQDLGRSLPDNSFSILGRIDHTQLRGCNLMAE